MRLNTQIKNEDIDECVLGGSYYNLGMLACVGLIMGAVIGIFLKLV